MEKFLIMKKNNKGKEILKLLQDNYDIQSAQELSRRSITRNDEC